MTVDLLINGMLFDGLRRAYRYPETRDDITASELVTFYRWGRERGYVPDESIVGAELEEIQADYTRLFVNAVPAVLAQPFAGWYMGDRLLCGEIEHEIRNLYHRYGVDMGEEVSYPADHILVELEFLEMMRTEWLNTGEDIFYSGLREIVSHLNNWIYLWLQSIQEQARTSYYRALSLATASFFNELEHEIRGGALIG